MQRWKFAAERRMLTVIVFASSFFSVVVLPCDFNSMLLYLVLP